MGSKFVARRRRKSLLAALLLLLRGKARYAVLLVMVLGASAPFVVSQDMLYRLVQFAPVSYMLRATGLGGVITALDSPYSNDILRAAINRAMHESDQDSVWSGFLRGMSGTMTGAGSVSSLAMLRGGEDLYRAGKPGKPGKAGGKPGEVAGAVSDADKARGAGADAVNFEDYLADAAGAGGLVDGSGFGYMNGAGGSGSYGGALGSGSPFMDRSMLGGNRGVGGVDDGMYGSAMNQASNRVPVAANRPVSGQKMGRASGFSWRNAGYRGQGSGPVARINKQGAMFRLAETFTMTGAAYKNSTASSEYQASHMGATYDGNEVGLQEIQTDTAPPPVPDNSWISNTMQGVGALADQTDLCSMVSGENDSQISENVDKIDKITAGMGNPPKCCDSGAVSKWNGEVEQIKALCRENNARNSSISAACQTVDEPVQCSEYDAMKLSTCSTWKCYISLFIAMVLIGAGFYLLGPLGIALIAAGTAQLVGYSVDGKYGDMLSAFGSIVATLIGGSLVGKALDFISRTASQIGGSEDGSTTLDNDSEE